MYKLYYTNRMKRDVKRILKRGKDINKLNKVLNLLIQNGSLPKEYLDHQLTGNLKDFRECHIESDWLLMYQIIEDELIITATSTGSHSDIFGK